MESSDRRDDIIESGDGTPSQALACAFCKKRAGQGTKLSQCSRCCGPSYCGRSCQEAAWKGGHKGECSSMARELYHTIIARKGGMEGMCAYLTSSQAAVLAEEGHLPLEDRHQIKVFILLSRTVLARDSNTTTTINLYLISLSIMGNLAAKEQGTDEEPLGSDAWREATFKELRGALDKYRDVIMESFSYTTAALNMTSMNILERLGRVKEAVALGREELPAMEAMPWDGALLQGAHLMIDYSRQLAKWLAHGNGLGRNLTTLRIYCDDKESIKQSMEAELMLRKAIELADKQRPVDEDTVWSASRCLASLLGRRQALREAYPYGRRAFEMAPLKHLPEAALTHAIIAQALARYTEAEEVLRYALFKLGDINDKNDKPAARLRLQLGELSCARGMLDEASMHVSFVSTVYKPEEAGLDSQHNFYFLKMFKVSAGILEKMGKLEEALICDGSARHLVAHTREVSWDVRRLKKAVRDGDLQEARSLARSILKWAEESRNFEVINSVPNQEDNTALEVIAEVLVQHGNEPNDGLVAAAIRADVAESRAITQALQDALLVNTRQEALAARRLRDAENEWLDIGTGSRSGKKGKRRRKKADKAKGKNKSGTSASTDKQTGPDTARAGQQQEEEEEQGGGAEAGAAEDSEHGPAEAVDGGCAEEEGTEECAVCLLDFDDDEEEAGVLLVCGHRFHGPCVDLWVSNCSSKGLQATCPMCRTDIKY